MTPRHRADRALARVRAWWTERRAFREAREDEEASWLASLPEDQDLDIFGPITHHGYRYQGPPAQPGDIPNQPAGGAE